LVAAQQRQRAEKAEAEKHFRETEAQKRREQADMQRLDKQRLNTKEKAYQEAHMKWRSSWVKKDEPTRQQFGLT